jgi:hypothetical protein
MLMIPLVCLLLCEASDFVVLLTPAPALQVAFSPTNCSFVQISEDSTIKWNKLHYPMEDANAPLQSGK